MLFAVFIVVLVDCCVLGLIVIVACSFIFFICGIIKFDCVIYDMFNCFWCVICRLAV